MSSIKISEIRIAGFRGLRDISIPLDSITVLTGCNNVGKTSVLKALQLALGNINFLTQEDFFVGENDTTNKIIIDILFIPVDEEGNRTNSFSEQWETIFTESCIQMDSSGDSFVGLRTTFDYDASISNFARKHKILKTWKPHEDERWQDLVTTTSKFNRESIPFFYIEAQRDIVEDIKLRTSFIGKLLSEVSKSYTPEKLQELEEQIRLLNETAINNSEVLTDVQNTLKEIESAIDNDNSEVSITPFTKKIRDLNKGITIHYGNSINSYTMDYHGMGTRSWSSLLTFKSFVLQHKKIAEASEIPFYPIITIEEPEAHLHPDAQKRLYKQISEMPGQKIVSTHSPYIAATANIFELRNMYKNAENVLCGRLDKTSLDDNEIRALRQKVLNTKGEIIFSKCLIFFEGETEEQALPIFAEKYFGCPPVSLGIDFVGVGGCGNYFPFIYLANKLQIPWYIFSDGETDAMKKVLQAYNKAAKATITDIKSIDNIFVIENYADFELMLINDGYIDEITLCLKKLLGENCIDNFYAQHNHKPELKRDTGKKCEKCGRPIIEQVLTDYSGEDGLKMVLDRMMALNKTAFAPLISNAIVDSAKDLPPLVISLFEKIKEDLHICL